MKASAGFGFFLLFLAGIALVSLMNMRNDAANAVPTAEQLAANTWRPSNIGEMRLDSDSGMFVQFGADGELTGHGGCNSFFSRYALEDSKIEVRAVSMTRKSCEPDVMSLELSFVEALQLATTVSGVGSRMAMRNERGEAMLRFVAMDEPPAE
ncbi:MAG: META domain-containing protein [Woeseiaceae bacterium]|nr:META domain-containing protein [Woeseiaceae bacterium]